MGVEYLTRREIPASTSIVFVCEGNGKEFCGDLIRVDVPITPGAIRNESYCCGAKYEIKRTTTGTIDINRVVPKAVRRGARAKAR